MKKLITLFISFICLSNIAFANDGKLVVRGKTTISNSVGTARTLLVSEAHYVASTRDLINVDVGNSFDVLFNVKSGPQAKDCKDAIVGFSAGEGNFLPNADGDENYAMPELISFICLK